MSIVKKDDATYDNIINTARRIFFKEGRFKATTQEIADEAKVNRTLINYYFRKRDTLFDIILEQAFKEHEQLGLHIFNQKIPFREKLENFIDSQIAYESEYPYAPSYIVSRMNENNIIKHKFDQSSSLELRETITREINEQIALGNIKPIEPAHFILNLLAMLSFPVTMKPLMKTALMISNEDYEKLLSERKNVILNTLLI